MHKIFVILVILFLPYIVFSQEEKGQTYNLFKSKTYLKNPLDLRDPFKRRINKKKGSGQSKSREYGVYSNQNDSIENKPLENIRIIGVMIGNERRAMARVVIGPKQLSSDVYYIKEGMRIGPNGAEVKAILPGGIVLVEKIRNVYDQDEYLETVIPVSNE